MNSITPWSSVGYLTYKRTYSRKIKNPDNTEINEEFPDTINRVINACQNQLGVDFTADEIKRLRHYLLTLKGSVAGRFLWQLGTSTVDKLGLMSLQNCAFTVIDHPIKPFTWTFDLLMLGSGVGYSIQREYVYKLPPVKDSFVEPVRLDDKQASFIVPDTREGWVRLLHHTLHSAFYDDSDAGLTAGFSYSTQLIRGKGASIKGFGGIASGPEDLVRGIHQISEVIMERRGKQLRPIDCLDIMNIIGSIVVAGNVRRSAQIAIGDADDLQFLSAKNWEEGNIPNWRVMSNNSVVCNDIKRLPPQFWKNFNGKSEPYGLINLKLAQSVGRLNDTRYKDKGIRGFNPCVTGDTLIAVADGRNAVPIRDLIGTTYPVYTINDNKRLVIGKSVKTWKTRENAEIWKLMLDDGSVLRATPDHLIMKRNGTFCRLDQLTAGDSLMPFNSYVSNKHYRQISSMSEKLKNRNFSDEHRKKLPDAAIERYNHKVMSVEFCGYEDVYDMEVECTHNFGIITSHADNKFITSSGIFVHNCAEQGLESFETCNLAEIFLPNIKTKEEMLDLTQLLYRINKHSLRLPCHQPETEKIVHKNMRMGIGITGYLQCTDEQRSWLPEVYESLRMFDLKYSKEKGWPTSIKLTTIKPSGTLSLLPGVTPGVHPAFARYMIRRIRIASNHPLVDVCRDHGYPVEFVKQFDGTDDRGTMVIEFPLAYSDNAILAKDLSAVQQMEWVKRAQTDWSDNSVSVTVYYTPEELPEIKEYLSKNYNKGFKTLSFLLRSEHGFMQAPYEEISKDEYDRRVSKSILIESVQSAGDFDPNEGCETGVCPIR